MRISEVEWEKIGRAISIGDVNELSEAIMGMSGNLEECKVMGERTAALYEREYMLEIGLHKYASTMKSMK